MPRSVKAKTGWRASTWIPAAKLPTKTQRDELCEAAGLDPAEGLDRIKRMVRGVADAVALYRAASDHRSTAPRAVHIHAALTRLQSGLDDTAAALNALDDASLHLLRRPPLQGDDADSPVCRAPHGLDAHDAMEQLQQWRAIVRLALRNVDSQESRGRPPKTEQYLLYRRLADVFNETHDRDGANLPDFLVAGCKLAGIELSSREAQEQADQLVPKKIPT